MDEEDRSPATKKKEEDGSLREWKSLLCVSFAADVIAGYARHIASSWDFLPRRKSGKSPHIIGREPSPLSRIE
jgi:hypothetical protein